MKIVNRLLDQLFLKLLKRHAKSRPDLWGRRVIDTERCKVFITMGRKSDGYPYEELE
jgi:hypothetical protein